MMDRFFKLGEPFAFHPVCIDEEGKAIRWQPNTPQRNPVGFPVKHDGNPDLVRIVENGVIQTPFPLEVGVPYYIGYDSIQANAPTPKGDESIRVFCCGNAVAKNELQVWFHNYGRRRK